MRRELGESGGLASLEPHVSPGLVLLILSPTALRAHRGLGVSFRRGCGGSAGALEPFSSVFFRGYEALESYD